jgi:hypothetical protein
MSEIKKELHSFEEKNSFKVGKKEIIFILFTLFLGFYVGNILYGTNNLLQLLDLQNAKEQFAQRVKELNIKNAKLKKEYFELQIIKGQK